MARKLRYQLENVCYHVVTRIAHREFFFDDVEKEIVHKLSYNIYCNFTNYGSALQSWALSQMIQRLGYNAKLIDYCPEVLKEADPLYPFKLMWDKDEESRRMWELPMPAIRERYEKVAA